MYEKSDISIGLYTSVVFVVLMLFSNYDTSLTLSDLHNKTKWDEKNKSSIQT